MRIPLFYKLLTGLLFFQLLVTAQTTATSKEESAQNMNLLLIVPNGSPFLPGMYSSVTIGSAFYKNEFTPATMFFPGNKMAKSTHVRLDLLDNSIHFLNDKNEELIITHQVEKLVFENPDNSIEIFLPGSTLPTENATYKKKWFQLLVQNDISVYKLYSKIIFEYKPFNSGILEKTIETYEKYFIIKDGKLVESKKYREKK